MIQAPFNFAPLSEKVVFPNWAGQISHDIPFSDGMSGLLKLRIKAIAPIFIRNGHTRDDKENWSDDYKTFCHTSDGRYFIPATSMKGMIRNILEIASFSKMSRVTNKRYSIRDLNLETYKNYFKDHEVHCGWMTIDKDSKTATITDNGIPGRISAKEIDSRLHIGLYNFDRERGVNLTVTKNRYAKAKYELAKKVSLHGTFTKAYVEKENKVDGRMKVQFSENGNPGTIVFTGQPGIRKEPLGKKGTGKLYEFVFFEDIIREYRLSTNEKNGLFQDFIFLYEDSEDWKYLKKQARIPVFFTLNDKEDSIEYIGLSYMFRLPTRKHIKEFLNKKHRSLELDMSDCIFGTTESDALKGRVQFSHAFCTTDNPSVGNLLEPYMGGPKPTYYPFYTQQNGVNGVMRDNSGKIVKFKTFLDNDAKLRGWKRYPVHNKVEDFPEIGEGQGQNTSPFIPLKQGTEFECIVRYHNLRPIELGALLFALNVDEDCVYNLGFCKPYGYGAVNITIENMNDDDVLDMKEQFVNYMNCELDEDLLKSKTYIELRAMMMLSGDNSKAPLRYMGTPKVFADYKKQNARKGIYGEYQQNYSELRIKSREEIDKEKKLIEKQLARKKRLEEEEERRREEEKKKREEEESRIREQLAIHERQNKINAGFDAHINERYTMGANEGKYKVNAFKICESKVRNWLKTNNTDTLSFDEKLVLIDVIKRLRDFPEKKEAKQWADKDSQIWKKVKEWLGEEWESAGF